MTSVNTFLSVGVPEMQHVVPTTPDTVRDAEPLTLFTFGDPILDCGMYNKYGVDPGQLLVKNDVEHFRSLRAMISHHVAQRNWYTSLVTVQ